MLEPTFDQTQLAESVRLADRIYCLHEAGQPYDGERALLSKLTGQDITKSEVCGAFGSMASEDWAHILLLASRCPPDDLSRDDLLEITRRVCMVIGPEWLQHWYLRCLERATGCDFLDIMDSPEDLSPEQVLDRAFRFKRRVLITPPPPREAE